MPFAACKVQDAHVVAGQPRIDCACGTSVAMSFYAQHVANAVAKDLIERCIRAEERLRVLRAEAQNRCDSVGVMNDPEPVRLEGKRSGVELARRYVEEIPDGKELDVAEVRRGARAAALGSS